MTQDLLERTVREWVLSNPERGARDLSRLTGPASLHAHRSAEEVADQLIRLAAKVEIAANRLR